MLLTRLSTEDNPEVKQRLLKTVKKYGIVLGSGVAYLIIVLLTKIRIPCLFHELTGLQCAGCGATRMFVSIARFDFVSAFKYNPYLFLNGPFLLIFLFFSEVKYIRTGNSDMGKWMIFIWVDIALSLVFGIVRNIIHV